MENQIVLKQAPVIVHKLQEAGKEVTRRIEELNIDSLVATEDSLKSLKSTRADLNKELKEFEEQRKFIKKGVAKPYQDFEAIYKEEISGKYTEAVEKLKDKIETVEIKLKEEKREQVKAYFDELCAVEKLDFLTFEKTGIEINRSTSLKAYKEKAAEFVDKVKDDISLIETFEHQAEIMAQYKVTLNASLAIKEVNDRKERERQEAERILQANILKRKQRLQAIGLQFDEFSNSYLFKNEFITVEEIEKLEKDEFEKRFVQLETNVNEAKRVEHEAQSQSEADGNYNVAYVASPPKPVEKPLEAPTEEKKQKLVKASFEVTGTMEQLQALGRYLKQNNIHYKNI